MNPRPFLDFEKAIKLLRDADKHSIYLNREDLLKVLVAVYNLTSSLVTAEDFVITASEATSKFTQKVRGK